MTSDAVAQARHQLIAAIVEYSDAKSALTAASAIAAQASVGRDILARRRSFIALEDFGTRCRGAERALSQTVRMVRRTLPPKDIEAIAQKLDDADKDGTIVATVRVVLAERRRASA
ncbi:hypothetical protein [Azospirillum sp. SYSU D00513]|uniref:hypothetical protein n=1 Tax=Azospirillum sp. SYSU D00513 TaxID=2812561 RepID=UPI001A972D6B|nr:hypothetical protein [Azospirillum sp. SYSU D00513]